MEAKKISILFSIKALFVSSDIIIQLLTKTNMFNNNQLYLILYDPYKKYQWHILSYV